MNKFEQFNLNPSILKALEKKGFTTPSEIQEKIIPIALEKKHDIIGIAQTGTGKTAAFGLPIIELMDNKNNLPKAIILAPTRELAIQVATELDTYKGNKKIRITIVYGGQAINPQIKDINKGVDIIVGTPGRVLDLINKKVLKLEEIEHFVLDEADEMLKMGFIEDIETILMSAGSKKRVFLFSATMPLKIKNLSKKYMKKQIIIETEKKEANSKLVTHIYYVLKRDEKYETFTRIVDNESFFYGIVFCKTKADVDEVTKKLKKDGYDADCIHGDIMQSKRERILTRFRDQKINILVATDVAARGIDVENLTHVINYALPNDTETYVHRIGRTGRAGKLGIAISFISSKEKFMIKEIEKVIKCKFQDVKLPNKADIEKNKQEKFFTNIENKIGTKNSNDFTSEAEKLIEKFGAKETVIALLNEIKGKKHIKEESKSFTKNDFAKEGEVRLFIAKGKMDKFDKGKLLKFLEKETGISFLKGFEVKVCEKFSFVTVKADDAEKILDTFGNRKGRPLVEIASK